MSNNLDRFLTDFLNYRPPNTTTNSFMHKKFYNLVNKDPEKTLNKLFFELYLQHPAISRFSQLRSFLIPHFSEVYNGFSDYALVLQNYLEKGVLSETKVIISREARFITKEILLLTLNTYKTPLKVRSKLIHTLRLLQINPCFEKELPVSPWKLLSNLSDDLKKAELLAELPDFSGVYFTAPELATLWNAIARFNLTPTDEEDLEYFLNLSRKKQVLFTLKNFISRCPEPIYIKKASVIYISLGEIIPWTKHPFIRRLLAVSYQEALALMNKIK